MTLPVELPCPHCAARAGYVTSYKGYRIQCVDCIAGTGWHGTLDAAWEAWNKRAVPKPAALRHSMLVRAVHAMTQMSTDHTETLRDIRTRLNADPDL